MKLLLLALCICASLATASCSQPSSTDDNPQWVKDLITAFQSDPVGNPPQSIWRYEYRHQTVYYIPPQCCDQYSQLYDANGKVVCAPDGGITGDGDGRCPDFFKERTKERLIWQDQRKR